MRYREVAERKCVETLKDEKLGEACRRAQDVAGAGRPAAYSANGVQLVHEHVLELALTHAVPARPLQLVNRQQRKEKGFPGSRSEDSFLPTWATELGKVGP